MHVSDIGIPVQVTASVGKKIGIGIGLSGFVSNKVQLGTVSVFLLLGNFP